MTLTIPTELEQAVAQRAAQRQVSVEEIVREALSWYLRADIELLDELDAWQQIRDEALQSVDPPTP